MTARRTSRRLTIEGLESRWALASDPMGTGLDAVTDTPAVVVVQADAATTRGESARLEAWRDTSPPPATPYRPAPVLRATAVRRLHQPRATAIRAAAAPAPEGIATPASGDFNGDFAVDRGDVAVLAAHWGRASGASFGDGDLTGDGVVALADLAGIVFSSPALDVRLTANVTNVDNAGDVINYTYLVENTGNSTLTGIAVTDNRGLVPTRHDDIFDDGDDLLEFGEMWRYTASYTVVQADLAGGEDLLTIVTVDSDQTGPDTSEVVIHNMFEVPQITIGDVTIIPIDHASFVMTWNGVTIYSDPVGSAALFAGLPLADLVLVTHQHGDHYNAGTIANVDDTDVRIVTSQTVFNLTSFAALRPMTTTLAYGASTTAHGVTVTAVHAYNGNHPLGTGNGYIVTLGEQRIYIAGDTGAVAEVRALDDIDIAFLCMNVPFTMNVTDAASVTRDIAPRNVIPFHYRNQDGTYANLSNFTTLVGTDLGINVRILDWY